MKNSLSILPENLHRPTAEYVDKYTVSHVEFIFHKYQYVCTYRILSMCTALHVAPGQMKEFEKCAKSVLISKREFFLSSVAKCLLIEGAVEFLSTVL